MKVFLELLFNYRCSACDRWWSVSDLPPVRDTWVQCPRCPVCPSLEGVEYQPATGLSADELQKLGDLLQSVAKQLQEQAENCREATIPDA